MADTPHKLALAKRFESAGSVDEAVRAYLSAGSLSDAVRILVDARRYREAATIVMRHVGVTPFQAEYLQGPKRRLAHRAAMYYASAGMTAEAVAIFRGLGDERAARKVEAQSARAEPVSEPPARLSDPGIRKATPAPRASSPDIEPMPPSRPRYAAGAPDGDNAVELAKRLEAQGQLSLALNAFVKLKRFADAGRVSETLGDLGGAAAHYATAGRFAEASRCIYAAGDKLGALDMLTRVTPDSAHYRQVCRKAIQLAVSLDRLDFKLDHLVGRFVKTGVGQSEELAAFYALGRLYEKHEYTSSAVEVYGQIEAFEPTFRDVQARAEKLAKNPRAASFDAIVEEDAAFRSVSRSQAPSLDELPELPDLPGLPGEEATRAAATTMPPAPKAPGRSGIRGPLAKETEQVIERGTVVGGRYRVERLIGEGGMAEVYEAHDLELDLRLALKLFNADAESETLVERFRRELMLARELIHPNVVRVYDIGLHGERRFISMELLSGTDLRDRMDKDPPTWGEALDFLIQACAGLHVAHSQGVIHRDVKPENFFLTNEGVLKVMDFGIAKKATATSSITQDGFTAGTPAYMSPDQIRDFGNVTPASDVYAVGVIAYELFTGELPFYHETAMSLMMMHINDDPPALTLLEPDLPHDVEDIVLHALAKERDERILTCAELGRRFQAALDAM